MAVSRGAADTDDRTAGTGADGAYSDSGAAMVEFALILPLLLAFLLGTVTAGISYNRNISLNNSARETARYGAVSPIDGNMSQWLTTLADVAVAAASGDLDPVVDGQYVCVAFVHPDGSQINDRTTRLVEANGVRTETAGQTCFTDGRPSSERRVQVQISRRTNLEALIYTQTLTLRADSIARYERSAG